MKAFLLLLAMCVSVQALTLTWDFNPAGDHITAYNVYRIKAGRGTLVTSTLDTINSIRIDNYLSGNRTTFYVTATNMAGESVASSRVTVQKH